MGSVTDTRSVPRDHAAVFRIFMLIESTTEYTSYYVVSSFNFRKVPGKQEDDLLFPRRPVHSNQNFVGKPSATLKKPRTETGHSTYSPLSRTEDDMQTWQDQNFFGLVIYTVE